MKLKEILYFAICFLLVGVAFASCDSDNDIFDSPVTSEWEFNRYEFDVDVTDPILKDSVTNFLKNTAWAGIGTYTFRENGTYTIRLTPWCGTGMEYPKDYFHTGTYSFKGDSILFDGSNSSYLFKNDTFLYCYGSPYNRSHISEYLKIDSTKIVKAVSKLVYNRVK